MKTTHALFSFLFVITLSLLQSTLSRHLTQFPFFPPVVDIEGKPLTVGEPYFVLSDGLFYKQEGLCLVNIENTTSTGCKHDVVQCTLFDDPSEGVPVVFSTADKTEDNVVRELTPYNVTFSGNCTEKSVWGLTGFEGLFSKFVTVDPAVEPVQFRVEKTGFKYKFDYCTFVQFTPVCYSLGFIQDGGHTRLGVGPGSNPAEFYFKSGNATAAYKQTIQMVI